MIAYLRRLENMENSDTSFYEKTILKLMKPANWKSWWNKTWTLGQDVQSIQQEKIEIHS